MNFFLNSINNLTNINWANKNNYGYYFQSSTKKLTDLIQEYGQPDSLINNYGGLAIWNNRDIYKRIELHDTISLNNFPFLHNNIICLVIKIKMDKETWDNISIMCGNISYDILSHDLYVRCPTISYGNAIIAIIINIINNKISINDLKSSPILPKALNRNRLQDINVQKNNLYTIKKYKYL